MPIVSIEPEATYKIVVPEDISRHSGYFIIVGAFEPTKFFLNSKEMGSFQWVSALMTSYSRQMRAGVPIEDIIKDMKETFDPNGSYFIPKVSSENGVLDSIIGTQVNSIIHHLGLVLEIHMKLMIAKHEELDNA